MNNTRTRFVRLAAAILLSLTAAGASPTAAQLPTAPDGAPQRRLLAHPLSERRNLDSQDVRTQTAQDGRLLGAPGDDGWYLHDKLALADGTGRTYLGEALAMDGDIVVVGAYGDGNLQGAAYVFQKPEGGWDGSLHEGARLVASDGSVGHEFGRSVAISGDTVVIGAYPEWNAYDIPKFGAVYVFQMPAGGWQGMLTESAKLVPAESTEGSHFGMTVGMDGDTVVVGASLATVGSSGPNGAAYVFTKPASGWAGTLTESAKLAASDGAEHAYFGAAVAIRGDTLVVGALYADVDMTQWQGAAYVFQEPTGGWRGPLTEAAKVTASDGAQSDHFGEAIAIDGENVVVGAPWADVDGSRDQGAAYVFDKPGGGWTGELHETAKLTASDGAAGNHAGQSVAIEGDCVVIGAPGGQGAAYVFENAGPGWVEMNKLAPAAAAHAKLGTSVSISDDMVVAGAPAFTDQNGAAYVFQRPPGGWATMGPLNESAQLAVHGRSGAELFGQNLALDGDTAVVGVPYRDIGGNTNQGAAYVFQPSNGMWTQAAELVASDGQAYHRLGYPVAIGGDTVVVASRHRAAQGANRQAAYVFGRSGDSWAEKARLTISSADRWYDFDVRSLAVSADTVLVGIVGTARNDYTQEGAAYVFEKPPGGWAGIVHESANLLPSAGQCEDYFGLSVAIGDSTVVVGAPLGDQPRAYVFEKPGTSWVSMGPLTEVAQLTPSNPQADTGFGFSVATNGATVIVAAPWATVGDYPDQGLAYAYERPAEGWAGVLSESQQLVASDGIYWDAFGGATALSSDVLVIGAEAQARSPRGVAYVFEHAGSGWTEVATLTADTGKDSRYATAVAVSGRTVLVGAYGADNMQGAAYLFGDLLSVEKHAQPAFDLARGSEVTYTIVLANHSTTEEAADVDLTDILPAQVDFARWLAQPHDAEVSEDVLSWNGAVPAGGLVTSSFVVSHTGDYGDVVSNTAQVEHATGGASAQATFTVAGPPVLSIVKTASPDDDVTYHGEVTYTIAISNSGPSDAEGVALTDALPSEVDFARWLEQPHDAEVSEDVLSWNGAVPAGGLVTFSFVVSHTGDYGDAVSNTARYEHATGGASAQATFTVAGPPVLSIAKTATPGDDVTYHGEVTYTLAVSNSGPSDAQGVALTDTLPSQVDFARWVEQPSGAAITDDVLSWTGDVPAGSLVTSSFVVTHVGGCGDVVANTVQVEHASGSGSAQATFTVADLLYLVLPVVMN